MGVPKYSNGDTPTKSDARFWAPQKAQNRSLGSLLGPNDQFLYYSHTFLFPQVLFKNNFLQKPPNSNLILKNSHQLDLEPNATSEPPISMVNGFQRSCIFFFLPSSASTMRVDRMTSVPLPPSSFMGSSPYSFIPPTPHKAHNHPPLQVWTGTHHSPTLMGHFKCLPTPTIRLSLPMTFINTITVGLTWAMDELVFCFLAVPTYLYDLGLGESGVLFKFLRPMTSWP